MGEDVDKVTMIRIGNGKVRITRGVLDKGNIGALYALAERFKGIVELRGEVSYDFLDCLVRSVVDAPISISNISIIVEGYDVDVGFCLHLSRDKLVLIVSQKALPRDYVEGLIRCILSKVSNIKKCRVCFLSDVDPGVAISLVEGMAFRDGMELQLDGEASAVLVNDDALAGRFNRIRIYHVDVDLVSIDLERSHLEIFKSGKIKGLENLVKLVLRYANKFSRVDINVDDDLERIGSILDIVGEAEGKGASYVMISSNLLRFITDEQIVEIIPRDLDEEQLREAIRCAGV